MNCKNLNGAAGLYFTLEKVSIHQRHALESNKNLFMPDMVCLRTCKCALFLCLSFLCCLLSKGTLINPTLRNVHYSF